MKEIFSKLVSVLDDELGDVQKPALAVVLERNGITDWGCSVTGDKALVYLLGQQSGQDIPQAVIDEYEAEYGI